MPNEIVKSDNSISEVGAKNLDEFKAGVSGLLEMRKYFIEQVLPELKENQDFYTIKNKKSLAKGGAEKLASIWGVVAKFERDDETREMLPNVKDMVAFKCTLKKGNKIVGEGRGADILQRNQNDPNKTIKMAQKRAYIDAVIRTTGLSDIFTQDLEDSSIQQQPAPQKTFYQKTQTNVPQGHPFNGNVRKPQPVKMTAEQEKSIRSLANEAGKELREETLKKMNSVEADHTINILKEEIAKQQKESIKDAEFTEKKEDKKEITIEDIPEHPEIKKEESKNNFQFDTNRYSNGNYVSGSKTEKEKCEKCGKDLTEKEKKFCNEISWVDKDSGKVYYKLCYKCQKELGF